MSLTTRLTSTSETLWSSLAVRPVLLSACWRPQYVRGPLDPACPAAEVLFAGENVILGVHEGNATGVQVVVFLGVVADTADFDRDFAVAERVDDDPGLRGGLLKPGSSELYQ